MSEATDAPAKRWHAGLSEKAQFIAKVLDDVARHEYERTADATTYLYAAGRLMRHAHPTVRDPEWEFWGHIAGWFNSHASRALTGGSEKWTPFETRQFNRAVAAAHKYLERWECADLEAL